MLFNTVYLFEGVSMGVLMMFHAVNFKHGTLLADQQAELAEDSIVEEKLHHFSDSEIDAHSLADKSCSINEGTTTSFSASFSGKAGSMMASKES